MYNLVIPTYEKHYQYNVNFLDSFLLYCEDKQDVLIHFIVSNSNKDMFNNLIIKYPLVNIKITTLTTLINLVQGNETYDDSAENLSNFNTKYPFQSLKKLYAYAIVHDDYIVIDSENLCLKSFYMKDVFKNQKQMPIPYTLNVYKPIQHEVLESCDQIVVSSLIDPTMRKKAWFFVKSYWFYEKHILEHLMYNLTRTYGDSFNAVRNHVFFDYQMYAQFAHRHKLKDFYCVDDKNIIELIKVEHNFEYVCTVLNHSNVQEYCDYINEQDDRIVRLHWLNDDVKNHIINNTNVCIGTFHWD